MDESDEPRQLSPRHSPNDRELSRRLLGARFSHAGGYIRAREEAGELCTGPEWLPFNLWQTAEYGHGPESDCARALSSSASAEKLWKAIDARYGTTDAIALSLPAVCANAKARWAITPRTSPSEYREQRERLARNAEQLAVELERFNLHRDPDDHELPGLYDFSELMTQSELDALDQAVRYTGWVITSRALERANQPLPTWGEFNDIGSKARALGYKDGDLYTPAREAAMTIYPLMY
ncbi:hypothetical protein GCM10027359_30930 [Marilutibacter aestuarii]